MTDNKIDMTIPLRLEMTMGDAREVAHRITSAEMSVTHTHPNREHSSCGGINAVEQLERVVDMLNRSHGDLSYGLLSPEDAIRLWRAFVTNESDEYPDVWDSDARIAVLGYDPMIEAYRQTRLKPAVPRTKKAKPKVSGAKVRNAKKG